MEENTRTTPPTYSIKVVHCWSAPRSRSTAFCYGFEARNDCIVLDEPLYRTWLIQQQQQQKEQQQLQRDGSSSSTVVTRPYLDDIIRGGPILPTTNNDPDPTNNNNNTNVHCKWQRELRSKNERIMDGSKTLWERYQLKPRTNKIDKTNGDDTNETCIGMIFCKEMAKFHTVYDFHQEIQKHTLPNIETTATTTTIPTSVPTTTTTTTTFRFIHIHLLLLRDPVAVLSSWGTIGNVHGNNPTLDEIGIVPLLHIYTILQSSIQQLQQQNNNPMSTIVIDSDELVTKPRLVLQTLCRDLKIPFMETMYVSVF